MSLQYAPKHHSDRLVPRPYPLLKAVVIDLLKQSFGQSQADGLLGYRFCFHITDIIDINCSGGIIVTDVSDVVNQDTKFDVVGQRGITR